MGQQKRNTRSKQMVMSVLCDASSALCHEEIAARLDGGMDRVTIYRILQSFCDDGKAHRIVGHSGKTYYALCRSCTEGRHDDNHLHFHCTRCRRISCIETHLAPVELPDGYAAHTVSCLVSGCCPECRNMTV